MKKLTQEDIEKLKKYETLFEKVLKTSTIRGTSIQISKTISSIIDEKPKIYNWGCAGCMIHLYKRAAKLYFDTISALKEQEVAESATSPTEETDENKDESTTKRTRKKKSGKKMESEA